MPTLATFDTAGRPVTLVTYPESDGRITFSLVIGTKGGGRTLVSSMVHLSLEETGHLRDAVKE